MEMFTAEQLHAKADWYENQITDPENKDDPRYLRRWAIMIRKLANKKERAHEQKQIDGKPRESSS